MKIPMTPTGFKQLEDELKELTTVKRREISVAIGIAREHGDIKENAEYHAAKEEQSQVEARISQLVDLRSKVEVMNIDQLSSDVVNIGATVSIINDETEEETTYSIVSEYEADLENGLISNTSPLGRALMRKVVGDLVEVVTPGGSKYYEILDMEYKQI